MAVKFGRTKILKCSNAFTIHSSGQLQKPEKAHRSTVYMVN